MFLKRVNAHAERRGQSTSVLETFLPIPQLSETRIKSGRSVLCPIIFYLSIGLSVYFILNLVVSYNILSKRKRLRHFKSQTKCTEDSEE